MESQPGRSASTLGQQASGGGRFCEAQEITAARSTSSARTEEAEGRRGVIAHVVLFEPRADLSTSQRESFAQSFEHALAAIPHIRRARVGVSKNLGRFYDRQNATDFRFMAILEFDSEADLVAYLDHPAHQDLGNSFYATARAALAYDFELFEGSDIARVFQR